MDPPSREPIAVVGIGCRFPAGVSTAKKFWETLQHGTEVVGDVPKDRFDSSSFYDVDPQKYGTIRNRKGGFVDDIKSFDAEFFDYYPAEASRIDPQQRLVLEASVHALQDSGTCLEMVSGSKTGVFLGTSMYDYLAIQTATGHRDIVSPHVVMGTSICATANRVSHRLNLQGPSITLDTACSSSMTALHLACQSIWTQETEGALAGGVNAILRPEPTIMLSKAGFLSPDGSCKPFDASANGYVRSEGVGVVYLKPLSKARRDNDRIYACIRGSLINQDGYTPDGFAVPSFLAQARLLKTVYTQSGVDPKMVQYVEAHGPGTSVGDPIEANALGKELGQGRSKEEPLWIGSVKGNFGHLEGAAGIISFIKASLITFYGEIPPQPNHVIPNPSINFKSLRLAVPSKRKQLPRDDKRKRLVGLNSFGAGGSNAHIILEQAPDDICAYMEKSSCAARVFVLSAKSQSALAHTAKDLAAHLRLEKPYMEDVAYTLNMRRDQHPQISVVPANGLEDLCQRLDHLGAGKPSKASVTLQKLSGTPSRVAFVFSGQGGQWLGMGRQLADQESVFRDHLAAFDDIFTSMANFSIVDEIFDDSVDSTRTNKTTIAQPAIAAIQIALAKTLMFYGVIPESCVGHSIGEVAAAHISGAINLEEAVAVVYFRSQIQNKAAGEGSMLAAGVSGTEAAKLIQPFQVSDSVEIAGYNGPKMTTLTGKIADLKKVASNLESRRIFARFVKVDNPYHSRFMDPLKDDLLTALSPIQGRQAEINLYSTVTASVESGTHLTGEYWFRNIRSPVRYVETASRMIEDGLNFLVEIGPHPVLISGTRDIAEAAKRQVHLFPAMARGSDVEPLSCVIGAAYAVGIPAQLSAFNSGRGRLIDLPLYPFQRQHYWFEHPKIQNTRLAESRHPFLEDSTNLTDDGRGILHLRLSTGVSPFLTDHVVDGAIVFPMTGQAEATFLAASIYLHQWVWLEDIQLEQPVVLASPEDFPPQVMLEITSPANDFILSTRQADASPTTTGKVCTRGRINARDQPPKINPEAMESVRARLQSGTEVDTDLFYRRVEEAGLRYGEAFRCIRNAWRLGEEVFSVVELPSQLREEAARFNFHPALLDACLHTVFVYQHYVGDPSYMYLPSNVGTFVMLNDYPVTKAFTHIQMTRHDATFLGCDVFVYGERGQLIAMLTGLTAKRLQGKTLSQAVEYQVQFHPETEEQLSKVEADFENVLLLHPLSSQWDWLGSAIQRAFPSSRVHEKEMEAVDAAWETAQWGFNLDRRTLLILPALISGPPDLRLSRGLDAVIRTFSRVASWIHGQTGSCMVVVLTKGACITAEDTQCDPLASSLEAAARVMANELPYCPIRIIDLELDEMDRQIPFLEAELRTVRVGRHETVVALRSKGCFVRRIVAVDVEQEGRKNQRSLPARGGRYQAQPDPNGSFDSVVLRQQPFQKPGPDEVGIEVHAVGLNFKDVMNAQGLLGERAASGSLAGGQNLGLEIAGRVADIGQNVKGIERGAPVMARVSNGIAGYVVASRDLVVPVPSSLSLTQAACVQIIFLTAYYALVYLARLTSGESVLVHSAADGVGIAAIQIAKLFGARVYATAGSPSRRAVASRWGAEAVFDSRSLSFHDEVKRVTEGRGVDVVLNCLTGAMFSQSVACLAPFGRFLEIGTTDIYRNTRISLEQFRQNGSFFAVDVDRLAAQKPALHRQLVNEVCELFNSSKLMPPPITTYPVTALPTALKELSRSSVIGKAAVEMSAGVYVQAAPPLQLKLHEGRTYVITGGLSGLGLRLAKFLDERGAKHLVLVSRTGPKSTEDHAVLSDMQRRGTTIHIEIGDISNAETVHFLFQQQRPWPPIAGVIHCAGILTAVSAHNVTTDSFRQAFSPKAMGAWNLHQSTQGMRLDFFVLISSISSVVAGYGQLGYAAANQFLDGLAHHRRASGLPGISLNLGVLGDYAGMSRRLYAENRSLLRLLESEGQSTMSLARVLSALERSLIYSRTQSLAASIDWSMFFKAYPHLAIDGAYHGLDKQQEVAESDESKRLSSQLSGPERIQAITDILQSGLARILGVDTNRISPTEKIDHYSFDSLILTQVRSLILREIRVPYPLIKLFQGPSLHEIAADLDGISRNESLTAGPTNTGDEQSELTSYDGLTRLSSPWFVRGNPVNTGCPRVLCFHSMGVGASLFNPFLMDPPEGLDLVAVQLPGLETRADEPRAASVSEIVSNILEDMEKVVGIPHIIWGHSFGGIIAFEVLRALRRRDHPLPRLLVTGTIAPHLISTWKKRDILVESFREDIQPEYLLAVARYVENADFMRSILPLIRQDVPLLLKYHFKEEEPLDTTITGITARQDDIVYPEEVAAWKTHAKGFNLIEVDGDHWFVYRNRKLLRETLATIACEVDGRLLAADLKN
ncbi:Acyl transferase/acyl hydrolase/lysophospholipase [Aspergillus affinis]|uniref:Acyl transferase/acyl hydrolase/lysophospholipase n=1 Tax=Aspergillus affinis TaxID=1070780 RepID=UPI0022FE89F8|nr:Acyl transferase/acyl hydrolase/lysophospholipase [Aspergillus affinis]KAI9036258.1 Acyl transferase/acyl hydrolase/lysophospholipase [Aspergillus affinis]